MTIIRKSARKRAKQEFEQACIEHLDALYASAIKLTGSKVDAEEIVQDTYLKAFRFANKFEWGTNLKAWLFRVMTNTFINDYRHKGHERRYLDELLGDFDILEERTFPLLTMNRNPATGIQFMLRKPAVGR